jgi:two-component system, CAI-1 autoinducer sensor kinase/phosphatase CqsS
MAKIKGSAGLAGKLRFLRAPVETWGSLLEKAVLPRLLQKQRIINRDHDEARFFFLAWIGCICMPIYYVVWSIEFPQGFESPGLRALGAVLCLVAVFGRKVIKGRLLRGLQFVVMTYMLPFFFTFMFLKNQGSAVWGQSLLVALIVLFQFETRWATKSLACGVAIAAAAFLMRGDASLLASPVVLEQLPILCFTVLTVSVAKVGRRVLETEKLAGMAQALGSVSHELRTPLISVSANARGIQRRLKSEASTRQSDCAAILEALERIEFEVRHMNHLVDLFLMSASAIKQHLEPTEKVSMCSVVESVVARYPFAGQTQRDLVSIEVRRDFTFSGKHDLSVVLLMNLLRNALKALQRAGKGSVRIIVDGLHNKPRLLVIDTGCGIPERELPMIFERFYTYPPNAGSGIGLALCKDIIEAWHASIRCISRELAYTVVVLQFPRTTAQAVSLPDTF